MHSLFKVWLFVRKAKIILQERFLNRNVAKKQQARWQRLTASGDFAGINRSKRQVRIVVSLTSFPARIATVDRTVKSLLMQTAKPDRIVLWLADTQFPGRENDLPAALLELKRFGLEIAWCPDYRSYKKLVPVLAQEPDALIITTDDDVYYNASMVEILYKSYLEHPRDISCHRITKFYVEDGRFRTVAGGFDHYATATYLHKLTGCGGVGYPPRCLYKDIGNPALFMELAPTNDDIWFWMMGILNGTKVRVPKGNLPFIHSVEHTQGGEQLAAVNDHGQKLFWKQFDRLLAHYPDVKAKLLDAAGRSGSHESSEIEGKNRCSFSN